MNILPKKRWHVRTRENIARVRRDEAEAAKEEEEKQQRIKLAEQEARTNLLRARARSRYDGREDVKEEVKKEVDVVAPDGHVNFFAELEQGLVSGTATNKEHDEELKQEREKYEKQIGYLTYLGQDTVEATGNVSWYNKVPVREKETEKNEEAGLKHKLYNDPLKSVKQFCFSDVKRTFQGTLLSSKRKRVSSSSSSNSSSSSEEDKHKGKQSKKERKKRKKNKHKKKSEKESSSCSESSDSSEMDDTDKKKNLEKLRAERLRREEDEKIRSEKLLAKVHGLPYKDKDKQEPKPVMQQKYNSQFNPTLARQNYRD